MLEKIDFTLFYYIGAIALVMVANALFGAAKANKYGDFDWIILKKGMIKYLLILLGVTFTFGGGTFTIRVTNKNLFRYFKIYQSESQWRRDDGNEVCSIEPWRVDWLYR